MSRSVVLPQLGSVLMSVACGTTKGHTDAPGSRPWSVAILVSEGLAATRVMLIWVTCIGTCGHGVIQAWAAP